MNLQNHYECKICEFSCGMVLDLWQHIAAVHYNCTENFFMFFIMAEEIYNLNKKITDVNIQLEEMEKNNLEIVDLLRLTGAAVEHIKSKCHCQCHGSNTPASCEIPTLSKHKLQKLKAVGKMKQADDGIRQNIGLKTLDKSNIGVLQNLKGKKSLPKLNEIIQLTPLQIKSYSCKKCGLKYSTLGSLQSHFDRCTTK